MAVSFLMADAAYIQNRIYYGYGKAAQRLGTSFDVYHAVSPINPIVIGNLIGMILGSLSQNWAYNKAKGYGNQIWNLLADGRQIPDSIGFKVGDYFIGTDLEGAVNTYFIMDKETLLPIQAMQCNKVVTIQRAEQNSAVGFNSDYSGYTPGAATEVASLLPVCILNASMGRMNEQKLPTDTLLPRFIMYMPNLGGVVFKNRDIIIDDIGARYVLVSQELTDYGWRCGIQLLGT